ncbi:hypothetical protein [Enterococcus mundtii]|uniref:hypothetical protein n=1 Tax=Enterococcus mundtii TaxID=53346 RepID=UPI001A97C196|nr:hypothetical protein [Enterococcus mundtii]MBO1087251.1 hypothetical protein [Enterococcus mundtii]
MVKRSKIDQDVEIVVMNNVRGSFFYKSRNGDLVLDLDEFGDEEYMTFGDLKKMMASKRVILEKLKLIIVGVEDDEITVEDVVDSLRLTDTYNELKATSNGEIRATGIEDFILESTTDELSKTLNSSKTKLKNTIMETAVVMYRDGKLTDYNKMKLFAEKIGRKDFSTYWLDADLPDSASL